MTTERDLIGMLEDLDAQISKKFTAYDDQLVGIKQRLVGGVPMPTGGNGRTIGQAIAHAEGLDDLRSRKTRHMQIQVKNTIIGEAGSPQDPVDDLAPKQNWPGIVSGAFRQLGLLDVIPRGTATSNTVHYSREASWTNGAAEAAEGTQKAEATLTFAGVDEPVRTIAHFVKVSRQVLDDQPALQSYLDARLGHGVRQRLEAQIVNGNGTSPNIEGLTATGRHTDFVVDSGDNAWEALNRAKYQVMSADYSPDMILMRPADWGTLERTRTGISGDQTLLPGVGGGAPYLASGMTPRAWGMPVVLTNSVPSGKFFVAASSAMMLFERQGVTVEIFEQNEDDVEKNLVTVRAEMRAAFATFQPGAIVYGDLP